MQTPIPATGRTSAYLNVGAGEPAPGWLNLDASPWFLLPRFVHKVLGATGFSRSVPFARASYCYYRIRQGICLPFADESLEGIYGSHVLEHLWSVDIEWFLGECHRVLHRGGVARFVVPDLVGLCGKIAQSEASWVDFASHLETLPKSFSTHRIRAALEGYWGFPTAHKCMLLPDNLERGMSAHWQVKSGPGYLESGMPEELLALVESASRCEQSLIFELEKR